MRTTLSINDALLEEVRTFAAANGISLTRAANEIIRRGLQPQPPALKRVNGLGVVTRKPGTKAISLATSLRLLDEDQG